MPAKHNQNSARSSGVQIGGGVKQGQVIVVNIHNAPAAQASGSDVAKTLELMKQLDGTQRKSVTNFAKREFGTGMIKELDSLQCLRVHAYAQAVLKS
jgi:hypothetical protein